uniref:Uncharacterized protein n=1 Tax=Micrurus lemniscatus lemniscatus TaxID=129467 RepID=A0A2D4IQP7_MICLE
MFGGMSFSSITGQKLHLCLISKGNHWISTFHPAVGFHCLAFLLMSMKYSSRHWFSWIWKVYQSKYKEFASHCLGLNENKEAHRAYSPVLWPAGCNIHAKETSLRSSASLFASL